jgi:hypothetical protein
MLAFGISLNLIGNSHLLGHRWAGCAAFKAYFERMRSIVIPLCRYGIVGATEGSSSISLELWSVPFITQRSNEAKNGRIEERIEKVARRQDFKGVAAGPRSGYV